MYEKTRLAATHHQHLLLLSYPPMITLCLFLMITEGAALVSSNTCTIGLEDV